MPILIDLLLAANEKGFGGRGDDPDSGVGVLVIVGIALLVIVAATVGAMLLLRSSRRRPGSDEGSHPRGRVGRL
jgi:hypothetical protein